MSKGGKSKQETKLPQWYEDAAKAAISKGEAVQKLGYVPYIGADVAALAPQSEAAIGQTDAWSQAFGMPSGGGASYLPSASNFAGGVKGYSSFPLYSDSIKALEQKFPGIAKYLASFSVNPGPGGASGQGAPAGTTSRMGGKGSFGNMFGGGL